MSKAKIDAYNQKWKEWVEFHADLFGMSSATDAKLFRSWKALIGHWPLESLKKASVTLAENPERARADRSAHYGYLREILREQEREQKRFKEFEKTNCALCSGAGWLSVPHLKSVINGTWTSRYTMMVSCACAEGWAWHQSQRGVLSLPEYEAKVPSWKEMLKSKPAIKPKLREVPARVEKSVYQLLEEIKGGFGQMPKEEG